MATRKHPWLLALLSLGLALVIGLSAWRSEWLFWKPPMVLLIALYWLLFDAQLFGLVFAFSLGLLSDFVSGSLAGESAMAFCIVAYVAQVLEHRLSHFTIFHQCLLVAGLVALHQVISIAIELAVYGGSLRGAQFYPVVSAFLLWPFIVGVLSRLHRFSL